LRALPAFGFFAVQYGEDALLPSSHAGVLSPPWTVSHKFLFFALLPFITLCRAVGSGRGCAVPAWFIPPAVDGRGGMFIPVVMRSAFASSPVSTIPAGAPCRVPRWIFHGGFVACLRNCPFALRAVCGVPERRSLVGFGGCVAVSPFLHYSSLSCNNERDRTCLCSTTWFRALSVNGRRLPGDCAVVRACQLKIAACGGWPSRLRYLLSFGCRATACNPHYTFPYMYLMFASSTDTIFSGSSVLQWDIRRALWVGLPVGRFIAVALPAAVVAFPPPAPGVAFALPKAAARLLHYCADRITYRFALCGRCRGGGWLYRCGAACRGGAGDVRLQTYRARYALAGARQSCQARAARARGRNMRRAASFSPFSFLVPPGSSSLCFCRKTWEGLRQTAAS